MAITVPDIIGSYDGQILNENAEGNIYSSNVPSNGGLRSLQCEFTNKFNGGHQEFRSGVKLNNLGKKFRIVLKAYPKAKPKNVNDDEYLFGGGTGGFDGVMWRITTSQLQLGFNHKAQNITRDATTWTQDEYQTFEWAVDITGGNSYSRHFRNNVQISERTDITQSDIDRINLDALISFGKTIVSNGWSRPFYGQIDNVQIYFDPLDAGNISLQAQYDFEEALNLSGDLTEDIPPSAMQILANFGVSVDLSNKRKMTPISILRKRRR